MDLNQLDNAEELGQAAAKLTAYYINDAIYNYGSARLLLSSGASQFTTLKYLISENVDWNKVIAFHLDEYIGISDKHNASFRKYMKERFVSQVPISEFHYVNGTGNIDKNIIELNEEIYKRQIDIALIGIGENCHIAFNDPPCNIEINDAYHIVTLDKRCRNQQVGEGWFTDINEVPAKAISMTVNQILKSSHIISAVPYLVKAQAVYDTFNKTISPSYPSTYLRTHSDWHLYIDKESGSLLNR